MSPASPFPFATTWLDAHLHLDFFCDPRAFLAEAATHDLSAFANTVTPAGYRALRTAVGQPRNAVIGLGQHPWWVAEADLDAFDELEPSTRYVGEVGLDFSPRRDGHERQLEVFEHIARRCAATGDKVLSIHSVRAASVVLDVLEETGCLDSCTCIFHWFSGSTDELWRAIRAGCWFSVNQMQAGTRRAKEQLKLIPDDHLLLETDLPPQDRPDLGAGDVVAALERARALVQTIRGAWATP